MLYNLVGRGLVTRFDLGATADGRGDSVLKQQLVVVIGNQVLWIGTCPLISNFWVSFILRRKELVSGWITLSK